MLMLQIQQIQLLQAHAVIITIRHNIIIIRRLVWW